MSARAAVTKTSSARPSPADPSFAEWLRENLRPDDVDGDHADDLSVLRPFGVVEERPPRRTVFRPGNPDPDLYVIEQGYVDIFAERGSERRILRTCGPGCTFGELPVGRRLPGYRYGAVTRTTARTLRLPRETIQALVDVHPAICLRFLRLVARCLTCTEQRLLELSGRSALERTARFLLREAAEQGTTTVTVIQGEVAAELGLSRQTVNRVLGELEAIGLISRRRGALGILERRRLEAIADPAVAQ